MKAASPHLYKDSKITLERLDAFANASRLQQAQALGELRRRASDDANDVQTSITVGIFGVLGTLIVAPNVAHSIQQASSASWALGLSVGAALGIVIAIVAIPVIGSALTRGAKRERAGVWARAFEDELDRMRTLPGKPGRAWRRSH